MKFFRLIGVFYLGLIFVVRADDFDSARVAFEKAIKSSASSEGSSNKIISPQEATTAELDSALADPTDASAEMIIAQLTARHPSAEVQEKARALTDAFEKRRAATQKEVQQRLTDVLAQVGPLVRNAKNASDLDEIIKELHSLTSQRHPNRFMGFYQQDPEAEAALQFLNAWQQYLAAAAAGNHPLAAQALEQLIRGNGQIEVDYLPRSELLNRLLDESGTPHGPKVNSTTTLPSDPTAALEQIKTVEELSKALPDLKQQYPAPLDWSGITMLDQARRDLLGGAPATLDLKGILKNNAWSGSLGRCVQLEMMAILPFYFESAAGSQPRPDEKVLPYLDRLIAEGDASENLALLQRAFALKIAIEIAPTASVPNGTEQFLAGLTQEAAGQNGAAVTSYENSLKDPDQYLDPKIVGTRLARIQADHPADFQNGFSDAMSPVIRTYVPQFGPNGMPLQEPPKISVLPIPMTISVSAPPPEKKTPSE